MLDRVMKKDKMKESGKESGVYNRKDKYKEDGTESDIYNIYIIIHCI